MPYWKPIDIQLDVDFTGRPQTGLKKQYLIKMTEPLTRGPDITLPPSVVSDTSYTNTTNPLILAHFYRRDTSAFR